KLGHFLAERGRPDEAEALFRQAVAAHRKAVAANREAVRREVARLKPDDAIAHNNLAWRLATQPDLNPLLVRDPVARRHVPVRRVGPRLDPGPLFPNSGQAVQLATRAVELGPKQPTIWNTLGAAHYRAGDWKASVGALHQSMDLGGGGDSFDWFFLAMAHW